MAYTGISMLVLWICLFLCHCCGYLFWNRLLCFYMHMSGEEKKSKVLYKYMINPIWGLINICCVLLCRYDCFISISNSLFEYNDFNSWFNSTYLYNHQRLQLYFINKRADISLPWLLIYCLSGLEFRLH